MSRFKLGRKVQEIASYIYIRGDPAHGPSSVLSGKAKTDIDGKEVRAIEGKRAV